MRSERTDAENYKGAEQHILHLNRVVKVKQLLIILTIHFNIHQARSYLDGLFEPVVRTDRLSPLRSRYSVPQTEPLPAFSPLSRLPGCGICMQVDCAAGNGLTVSRKDFGSASDIQQ